MLSDESHRLLTELMRFRHFKRYYLELDYDWEKRGTSFRCSTGPCLSRGQSFRRSASQSAHYGAAVVPGPAVTEQGLIPRAGLDVSPLVNYDLLELGNEI